MIVDWYDLVEVEWVDSVSEGGWSYFQETLSKATTEAMDCTSVGYLVKDHHDFICLAEGFMHESNSVYGVTQIPKVSIKEITTLRARM